MIKIAIVDDNLFLQKTVQEKLSFFEDIEIKSKSLNGKELLQKLEKNSKVNPFILKYNPMFPDQQYHQHLRQKNRKKLEKPLQLHQFYL